MAEYNVIAISGLPGSGKDTQIKIIQPIYGWDVYSIGNNWRAEHKLYEEINPDQKMKFSKYWETKTDFVDNILVNVIAKRRIKFGNLIVDSRYSVYTKDLPNVYRIFIFAELEKRALWAKKGNFYSGKSVDEIKKELQYREDTEVKIGNSIFDKSDDPYFKIAYDKLFGVDYSSIPLSDILDKDGTYDYRDPKHYHEVIDSTNMTIEGVTEKLLSLVPPKK